MIFSSQTNMDEKHLEPVNQHSSTSLIGDACTDIFQNIFLSIEEIR